MVDARAVPARLAHLAVAVALVLVLAATLLTAVASGADAAVRARTDVTIASIRPTSGALLVSGEPAVIRGTTSKNLVGATLRVQRWRDGVWVTTRATATVRPDATFRIPIQPGGMGFAKLRVRFAGTAHKAPSNDAAAVTLWRWISLVPYGSGDGIGSGTAELDGWHYARALRATGVDGGATDRGSVDLDGKCDRVFAVIGVDDSSQEGFVAELSASLDGVTVLDGVQLTTGRSAVLAVKTSGRSSLVLEAAYPELPGVHQGTPVWAQPQGLCRAHPGG